MTKSEHIKQCKKRALNYVNDNYLTGAFVSMVKDLRSHPETNKHPSINNGLRLLATGLLTSKDRMQKFINDIN